jgi:hypothetical protein
VVVLGKHQSWDGLAPEGQYWGAGDPSLRLKNGCAQDDAFVMMTPSRFRSVKR